MTSAHYDTAILLQTPLDTFYPALGTMYGKHFLIAGVSPRGFIDRDHAASQLQILAARDKAVVNIRSKPVNVPVHGHLIHKMSFVQP